MSSTWIQMPVENAKEVAERFIQKLFDDTYISDGNDLKDEMYLTYDSECEIYMALDQIQAIRSTDKYVYIGNLYVIADNSLEQGLTLNITTGTSFYSTVQAPNISLSTSSFPVIFNDCSNPMDHHCFFIGYKFNVNNP